MLIQAMPFPVSTEWTPAAISGAAHWWAAEQGVASSGGFMTSWTDQIGALTLTSVGSVDNSTYNLNGLSYPFISAASNESLGTSSYSYSGSTFTLAAVCFFTNTSGNPFGRLFSFANSGDTGDEWNNTSGHALVRNDSTTRIRAVYNGDTLDYLGGYNSFYIIVVRYSGSAREMWINGRLVASDTPTTSFNINRFSVMAQALNSTPRATGGVAEILTCHGAISTADRTSLEAYWANKFDMAWSLPESHDGFVSGLTQWRVRTTGSTGGWTAIRELQIRNASGTNLCSGGTASADASLGGNPASNAFDGNLSNKWWSGASGNHWLQYTFPSPVRPESIAIAPDSADIPTSFELECYKFGSWQVAKRWEPGSSGWTTGSLRAFSL